MKFVYRFRNQGWMLPLFCGFFGCTTDFPTITPYKETMVIYGLLNPNDPVQYIRVSKAFLGEGNALVMSRQPDSIYYGDILDVKLERFIGVNLANTYIYSRIPMDSVPKDAGAFVAPYQAVYAGQMDRADTTNSGTTSYKLTVKNRQSGVTATASTIIIDNFWIPSFHIGTQDFTAPPPKPSYSVIPTVLAKNYNITMQLSYTDTSHVSHFLFDWNLGDQTNVEGNTSELPFSFAKSYLFTLDSIAAQGLPRDPTGAYIFTLNLIVTAGTNDLYTYMQATQPANSLVQDRPLYTNVQNGVGLFTCRNMRTHRLNISPGTNTKLDSYFQ